MFGSKQQGTVIGKELKIVGSVTVEGLVWVYGQIDGELHCTSLFIDKGAHISGTITAERVVVDGKSRLGGIPHLKAIDMYRDPVAEKFHMKITEE